MLTCIAFYVTAVLDCYHQCARNSFVGKTLAFSDDVSFCLRHCHLEIYLEEEPYLLGNVALLPKSRGY